MTVSGQPWWVIHIVNISACKQQSLHLNTIAHYILCLFAHSLMTTQTLEVAVRPSANTVVTLATVGVHVSSESRRIYEVFSTLSTTELLLAVNYLSMLGEVVPGAKCFLALLAHLSFLLSMVLSPIVQINDQSYMKIINNMQNKIFYTLQ